MKAIKFLLALLMLIIIFATCSENDPSDIQPDENKPEPTPIGIPNGVPSIQIIGASGGIISSADNVMSIDIPAGALDADTPIIIQPTTNNAPNGNGSAYQLSPEGIKFKIPVKITFKYNQEISATRPALTGIAYQDIDGIWYNPGKFKWDIATKTVSTETTHFSGWAYFDVLQIQCDQVKLAPNESCKCEMSVLDTSLDTASIVSLKKAKPSDGVNDYNFILKNWNVNGALAYTMGKYGKVTPVTTGYNADCIYTAPAKAPTTKNPVALSALLKNLAYKDPMTGKTFNDLQLDTQIEIIGEREYYLRVKYSVKNVVSDLHVDSARTTVLVKDGQVTFSNFENYKGNIIPASKTYDSGCTTTWAVGDYEGAFTFTSGTGTLTSDRHLIIMLSGTTTVPESNSVCPGTDPLKAPGGSASFTWPFPLEFNLNTNDTTGHYQDMGGFLSAILFPK